MLSNSQLKTLSNLKQKKFRERRGQYLIEGVRLCEEVLKSTREIVCVLHAAEAHLSERARRLLQSLQGANFPVERIDSRALEKLSETRSPQGLMAVVKSVKLSLSELMSSRPQNLIVLDKVRDPGNMGTILRTAAWFGMDGVILGHECVEATNGKVIRGSMGAVFHLGIVENVDLTRILPGEWFADFQILLADVNGRSLHTEVSPGNRNLLILGGETEHIEPEIRKLANATVHIKKYGSGDSLNVAVAAGILMAEFAREN